MAKDIETERRFLLKRVPDLKFDKELRISQFYLSEKKDKITSRIRMTSHKGSADVIFHHTTKERISKMSVIEKEREISRDYYGDLFDDAVDKNKGNPRGIYKDRLIYNVKDDLKWEVDSFEVGDIQLVIAEIEIPSEDYKLKIPDEFDVIMEITGIKQFSNSNLAE
jgi:CYTH domain-containing protein